MDDHAVNTTDNLTTNNNPGFTLHVEGNTYTVWTVGEALESLALLFSLDSIKLLLII